ncbi:hypothetical protein CDD83_10020 [Cordyceps sp. RAO-2017]|nr:hypothetical protein CDD83_10020 [Cordyceps sp. RAO-2017]
MTSTTRTDPFSSSRCSIHRSTNEQARVHWPARTAVPVPAPRPVPMDTGKEANKNKNPWMYVVRPPLDTSTLLASRRSPESISPETERRVGTAEQERSVSRPAPHADECECRGEEPGRTSTSNLSRARGPYTADESGRADEMEARGRLGSRIDNPRRRPSSGAAAFVRQASVSPDARRAERRESEAGFAFIHPARRDYPPPPA